MFFKLVSGFTFAVLLKLKKEIMKTIKKNSIALLLFVSVANFANTNITFDNLSRVTVAFTAVKKGHSLTIKDVNGISIYKESIKNSGDFSRTYDLTALEDGNYTAELSKDFEIIIKPFTVKNGTAIFIAEKERTLFMPIIRAEENIILLSKYNFIESEMDVKIYFEGDLIHTENVKSNHLLSRVYRLAKEQKGNYTIVVNTDGKTYEKKFTI
jgi:hypothetical protein